MRIPTANAINASAIVLRDIESPAEMREVETLQKDVWGIDDLDVVPATLLLASRAVGAVLIGAYDGAKLAGFVYAFPGYEDGKLVHHSHMLAVAAPYRNLNLGYQLKLAQRERVLAQGIDRITWTFDPLQGLNAYFNFAKLGVVADSYKINFYGEATSSFLHQVGTDRLWVTWLLDSERVRERLDRGASERLFERGQIPCLVTVDVDEAPQRNVVVDEMLGQPQLTIEIPSDINRLQNEKPRLAAEWREATRSAFTKAIAAGYFVADFRRGIGTVPVGIYLLSLMSDML